MWIKVCNDQLGQEIRKTVHSVRLQRLAVGCKSLAGRYFYPSAIRYFTGKPNLLMVKSFFNLKLHFDKEGMISTG